jgi:hypothetical protein
VCWDGRRAGERQVWWQAEPASAVGREATRRPANEESPFSINIFKIFFQIPSFKYHFEQENDIF